MYAHICTLIWAEASLNNWIITSLSTEDNISKRKAEKHISLLQNRIMCRPISVVILHLAVLHLCFPFSTLFFYHLLDLWFTLADWSQAGSGDITFHRPTATCVAFQKVCNTTADQYHRSIPEKTDLEWSDLYPYEFLSFFSDFFVVTQPLLWYLHLHQVSSEQSFLEQRILGYLFCCQLYELTFLAVLFEVSELVCRFWPSSFMCRLSL